MYKQIKASDLLILSNVTNIIDVRDPSDYRDGHIPNAINIPLYTLLENYEKYLKKDKTYYIYCQTGIRSSKICRFLFELGYNVIEIEDGYKGWIKLKAK